MNNTALQRKNGLAEKILELTNNRALIANEENPCLLQNINSDVLNIIIDFLKLSVESLVALSLTSSRWNGYIQTMLEKDLQHYYPISYAKYKGKRRCTLEDYYFLKSDSLDLQRFEFQTVATRDNIIGYLSIYPIPWAQHIIFVKSGVGYAIFDLNKKEIVKPFDNKFFRQRINRLCYINEHRKQIVIVNTEFKQIDWSAAVVDNTGPYEYDWLHVYNIDDEGSVQLVTKFKSSASDEPDLFSVRPQLFLDDNGIIWHFTGGNDAVTKQYSIDKNEEISPNCNVTGGVLGIGQWNNKVLIFYGDPNNHLSPISVFDASSDKLLGELPHSKSWAVLMGGKFESLVEVFIQNNMAIAYTASTIIVSIFDLDQFKCVYSVDEKINLISAKDMEFNSRGRSFAMHEAWWIQRHLGEMKRERDFEFREDNNLVTMSPFNLAAANAAIFGDTIYQVKPGEESTLITRLKVNRPVRETKPDN